MNELIVALTIGLAGSFHCIGMCGPIAFALPVDRTSWFSKIKGILAYNFGRVFTYAIIGAVFGALGQGIAIAGFQRWLSIILGAVLLLSVFLPQSIKSKLNSGVFSIGFLGFIRNQIGLLFKQKSIFSIFSIGFLNGFLPCGLVYIAVAGAIAIADLTGGAMYMMFFGLGTLPIMAVAVLIGSSISLNIRNKIRKAIPVFIAVIGVLFILRGLNLGIPYISPQYSEDCKTATCCKK